jgi:hypothetical protein
MEVQARIRDQWQPSWIWGVSFLLIPLLLTAVGFMGIWHQPVIPLTVASNAPRLAVLISLWGMVAAIARRRRLAVGLTTLGLACSVGGYLLLAWVQG